MNKVLFRPPGDLKLSPFAGARCSQQRKACFGRCWTHGPIRVRGECFRLVPPSTRQPHTSSLRGSHRISSSPAKSELLISTKKTSRKALM